MDEGKKIKILVVEDDEQTRFLYNTKLRDFHLEIARNGVDGIDKFRNFKPDLVITDLTMPQMDGCSLVRGIRELSTSVPVVIVTGINVSDPLQAEKIEEALRAGANRAMTKPFSKSAIISVIQELLKLD